MQCTPFRVVKFIPIECSGFHEAWLNAVFHEVWRNGTLLNAVDFMQRHSMQWISCSMIECSRFYAAWPKASRLNAEYSMPCGAMDPDCMQWSPCSVMNAWIPCSLVKCIPIECSGLHAAWLNAVDSMQGEEMEPYLMQWIPCSMIECSGFLQHYWMQWIPCTLEKCILIECSGFHAAWLNAVDSMQLGKMPPVWMQWIPCSVIDISVFHAAWRKGTLLIAV